MRPNSILYHCNDNVRCQKFLDDQTFMIESKEEGIWLGNGMYFWDNRANAEFWYRKKQKNQKDLTIVCSNVYTDYMLDLTDLDICNKMQELWIFLVEELELDNVDKATLGHKLNYLYQYFEKFREEYQIIKVLRKYKKTPPNKFFEYNLNSAKAEPTTAIKCIYNVKNIKAIATRENLV